MKTAPSHPNATPARHALAAIWAVLAENPNLEAWGKPSLWVNIKDLWY